MQRGIECLSPINTTVIAFEKEWTHAVHKGTFTLACTPKYIQHKSNCIIQAHMGADISYTLTLKCTHTHTHIF